MDSDRLSEASSRPFPLLLACAQGNLDLVRALAPKVAAEDGLDRIGDGGFTPFMAACAMGHVDVARLLLGLQGIDVNAVDLMGRTPVMAACGRGHLPVVKLLARHADVDLERKNLHGGNALMFAAAHGHLAVVKFLKAAGVSLEEIDDSGYTAFMLACHRGRAQIVQFLAACGVARKTSSCDGYALLRANGNQRLLAWLEATAGWSSPLHYAPWLGPERTLKLLRAGADIHERSDPMQSGGKSAASPVRARDDAACISDRDKPSSADTVDGKGPRVTTPFEIAERHASEPCGPPTEELEAENYNLHRHCREACRLVLLATQPWSRETRHLFPRRSRARARDLQVIARQIGNAPVNHQYAHALWDIWNTRIMEFAIARED